jgi:Short C-terminal domain
MSAAAPETKDTTAELQKLAELHKSGALTDEEFATMKKRLLGP